MSYLVDVNVWVAIASDRHVHSAAAKHWLNGVEDEPILFCRVTELGLLRLLTNRHVMGDGVFDTAGAWRVYREMRADPRVVSVPERVGFEAHWHRTGSQIGPGPNAWTDAYLAALASHERATVVTFDRRFPAIAACSVLRLDSQSG